MAPKRRGAPSRDPLLGHLVDVCGATPPSSWTIDTHVAAAQQLAPIAPSDAPQIHTIVHQAAEHAATSPACLQLAGVLLDLLGGGLDTQLLRYGLVRKLLAAGQDASRMALELHEGVHALVVTGEAPLTLVFSTAMVFALTKQHDALGNATEDVLVSVARHADDHAAIRQHGAALLHCIAKIPSMHPAAVAIAAMLNTMQCLPAALAQHVATHSTPVSLQQGIVLLHTAHSVECESACGACGRDTWKDACAYTAAGVAHLAAQLAAVDDDAVQWLDNKGGASSHVDQTMWRAVVEAYPTVWLVQAAAALRLVVLQGVTVPDGTIPTAADIQQQWACLCASFASSSSSAAAASSSLSAAAMDAMGAAVQVVCAAVQPLRKTIMAMTDAQLQDMVGQRLPHFTYTTLLALLHLPYECMHHCSLTAAPLCVHAAPPALVAACVLQAAAGLCVPHTPALNVPHTTPAHGVGGSAVLPSAGMLCTLCDADTVVLCARSAVLPIPTAPPTPPPHPQQLPLHSMQWVATIMHNLGVRLYRDGRHAAAVEALACAWCASCSVMRVGLSDMSDGQNMQIKDMSTKQGMHMKDMHMKDMSDGKDMQAKGMQARVSLVKDVVRRCEALCQCLQAHAQCTSVLHVVLCTAAVLDTHAEGWWYGDGGVCGNTQGGAVMEGLGVCVAAALAASGRGKEDSSSSKRNHGMALSLAAQHTQLKVNLEQNTVVKLLTASLTAALDTTCVDQQHIKDACTNDLQTLTSLTKHAPALTMSRITLMHARFLTLWKQPRSHTTTMLQEAVDQAEDAAASSMQGAGRVQAYWHAAVCASVLALHVAAPGGETSGWGTGKATGGETSGEGVVSKGPALGNEARSGMEEQQRPPPQWEHVPPAPPDNAAVLCTAIAAACVSWQRLVQHGVQHNVGDNNDNNNGGEDTCDDVCVSTSTRTTKATTSSSLHVDEQQGVVQEQQDQQKEGLLLLVDLVHCVAVKGLHMYYTPLRTVLCSLVNHVPTHTIPAGVWEALASLPLHAPPPRTIPTPCMPPHTLLSACKHHSTPPWLHHVPNITVPDTNLATLPPYGGPASAAHLWGPFAMAGGALRAPPDPATPHPTIPEPYRSLMRACLHQQAAAVALHVGAVTDAAWSAGEGLRVLSQHVGGGGGDRVVGGGGVGRWRVLWLYMISLYQYAEVLELMEVAEEAAALLHELLQLATNVHAPAFTTTARLLIASIYIKQHRLADAARLLETTCGAAGVVMKTPADTIQPAIIVPATIVPADAIQSTSMVPATTAPIVPAVTQAACWWLLKGRLCCAQGNTQEAIVCLQHATGEGGGGGGGAAAGCGEAAASLSSASSSAAGKGLPGKDVKRRTTSRTTAAPRHTPAVTAVGKTTRGKTRGSKTNTQAETHDHAGKGVDENEAHDDSGGGGGSDGPHTTRHPHHHQQQQSRIAMEAHALLMLLTGQYMSSTTSDSPNTPEHPTLVAMRVLHSLPPLPSLLNKGGLYALGVGNGVGGHEGVHESGHESGHGNTSPPHGAKGGKEKGGGAGPRRAGGRGGGGNAKGRGGSAVVGGYVGVEGKAEGGAGGAALYTALHALLCALVRCHQVPSIARDVYHALVWTCHTLQLPHAAMMFALAAAGAAQQCQGALAALVRGPGWVLDGQDARQWKVKGRGRKTVSITTAGHAGGTHDAGDTHAEGKQERVSQHDGVLRLLQPTCVRVGYLAGGGGTHDDDDGGGGGGGGGEDDTLLMVEQGKHSGGDLIELLETKARAFLLHTWQHITPDALLCMITLLPTPGTPPAHTMMATPPTPLTCRTTTATPWLPMNAYASCASVLCVCRYGPHMAVPVLVAVCPPVYHDDASDNNYDGDNDDIHENHDQEKNKHGREKKKKGVPGASSLSSALGALSLADHQTKENNNKACALSSSSAAAPTTIHTALEWLQGILHDSHTSMQALGNTEGSDGDTGENGTGDAEKHKRVLGKHNKTGTGTHVKIQPMQSSDHVSGHGSGHGSGHVSQRSKVAWWKRRLQLDARVGGVLDMMSDEVLGAARYLLVPPVPTAPPPDHFLPLLQRRLSTLPPSTHTMLATWLATAATAGDAAAQQQLLGAVAVGTGMCERMQGRDMKGGHMQEGYMSSSVAMNTYHTYYNDNDDMAVDNGDTQGQCEDVLMQCLHGGGGGGVDGGDELEGLVRNLEQLAFRDTTNMPQPDDTADDAPSTNTTTTTKTATSNTTTAKKTTTSNITTAKKTTTSNTATSNTTTAKTTTTTAQKPRRSRLRGMHPSSTTTTATTHAPAHVPATLPLDGAENTNTATTAAGVGGACTQMETRAQPSPAAAGGKEAGCRKDEGYTSGTVMLVLEGVLHALPWESMTCLKQHRVYRCISLSCAIEAATRWTHTTTTAKTQTTTTTHITRPPCTVNPTHAYYLLNPSGDLSDTQTTFEQWFVNHGWEGTSGPPAATPTTLLPALSRSQLFVYLGHGAGEQYLPSSFLRRLRTCPAALLMGCSSGRLRCVGGYAAGGTVLAYMLAGAPVSVANLWDVTDKDIDRFSMRLLEQWLTGGGDDDEEEQGGEVDGGGMGGRQVEKAMDRVGVLGMKTTAGRGKRKNVERSKGHGGGTAVGLQQDDAITDDVINEANDSVRAPKQQEQEQARGVDVAASVSASRGVCRLPWLIGAAPVCYGVPVRVVGGGKQ